MRVATSQIYLLGADAISRAQSELLLNQQRISSGKRMLSPADDPVGAAEAIVTTQAKNRIDRYGTNITAANEGLSLTESVLGDVTTTLSDLRTLAVNAGSGALSDADRGSLATEIESRLQQLLGLANTRDADGNYLFSGFQAQTQPFTHVGGTYVYNGDQGQRDLAVADGRQLAVSEDGAALFDAVLTGNGSFEASAGGANTGSGTIDGGSVFDAAALTGHSYRLQFASAAGVTTYSVLDLTAGTTESAGNAYVAGNGIKLHGMQVTIDGSPASGDQFTLAPGVRQSVFDSVQNLATALRVPGNTVAGKATIANGITTALQNLTQGEEAVLTVRAGVGARLRELDSLGSGNNERSLQYEQTLSRLQDLDYSSALSEFARQQLALEAAQKSFLQVSGLSLFKYL